MQFQQQNITQKCKCPLHNLSSNFPFYNGKFCFVSKTSNFLEKSLSMLLFVQSMQAMIFTWFVWTNVYVSLKALAKTFNAYKQLHVSADQKKFL